MADKPKSSSRKVRDKWKEKSWFKIYAPEMFNSIELGETPAISPDELKERITEATVQDLTGDFSKMHIKLRFRADAVKGNEIHTQFIGHNLTNDYVRRLTRRKRTKTEHVIDAVTRDGFTIRLKPMVVTERRIQSSQETSIRNITTALVKGKVAEMTLSEVVKSIVSGDMSKEIANSTKIIIPMKKVEIGKSEILSFPAQGFVVPPPLESAAKAEPAVETTAGTPEAIPAEGKEVAQTAAERAPEETPSEEEIAPEEIVDTKQKNR
ncbi:MAG: 30S ribosomal protein S3ae [Candidatus Thermoplasmatota archaeon]|jgi:small subunit ribosomal protein S3Ae|nr:30S ribosomal protein S3ae [Candidatus Sysuiplasma jiujiangense]MBX8639174.1 30S ribosomal protein S3ae [Candidatus Sysuiplasma jiujiangense]MBX8642203.1 30S ribosomal protein S3ae [Candidatus Sysuiplasma jiujiangense]MCL4317832.1 30S ribosomal protein S3ae [Candidatus Thermoplasmatota archaeon]MCL5254260.1 30S ribosomal protein S3ae [Candidatus Thermoplasmatota archaeon]